MPTGHVCFLSPPVKGAPLEVHEGAAAMPSGAWEAWERPGRTQNTLKGQL